MIREEAIHFAECLKHNWTIDFNDMEDFCDMAIEALENKPTPCEKCVHVKSCRKVIILKNRTYKLIKYCSQGAERSEP